MNSLLGGGCFVSLSDLLRVLACPLHLALKFLCPCYARFSGLHLLMALERLHDRPTWSVLAHCLERLPTASPGHDISRPWLKFRTE